MYAKVFELSFGSHGINTRIPQSSLMVGLNLKLARINPTNKFQFCMSNVTALTCTYTLCNIQMTESFPSFKLYNVCVQAWYLITCLEALTLYSYRHTNFPSISKMSAVHGKNINNSHMCFHLNGYNEKGEIKAL